MMKKFIMLVCFMFLMVCCFSMIAEPDWQGQNCFLANGISQTATPVIDVAVWNPADTKSLILSEAACASCHGDSRASPQNYTLDSLGTITAAADTECSGAGGGLKIDI